MIGDSFAKCEQGAHPATETGRWGVFTFQRDGSQVLEKDICHKKTSQTFSKRGLITLQKDLHAFQREELIQVF